MNEGAAPQASSGALSAGDLARIARLHVESLDDSLPGMLGERFACRLYAFLERSPRELLLVERVEGRVASVCVVSLAPATLQARILRATLPGLLGSALRAALRDSRFRAYLGGALRDALRKRQKASELPEITYIFTDAALRGRQLGRRLVQRVDEALRQRGHSAYRVKTLDEPANRALAFYPAAGFARLGVEHEAGRRYVEFRKDLGPR